MLRFHFFTAKQGTWVHKNDRGPSYCLTCHGNLCGPCKEIHKGDRLLRTHRIETRAQQSTEYIRKSVDRSCKRHPDQDYVTCCVTYQVPCCRLCVIDEHKEHSMSSLKFARADEKEELKPKLNGFEDFVNPNITESVYDVEKEKENYGTTANGVKTEVKDKFEDGEETATHCERIIMADALAGGWVYDAAQKKLELIESTKENDANTIELDFDINDFTLVSDGIIATDFENKRVVKISQNGEISVLINTAPMSPYGICLGSDNQIAVTMTNPSKLIVYSPDDNSIVCERYKDADGEEILPHGACLIARYDRKYLVTNGTSVVCILDNGDVHYRYSWNNQLILLTGHNAVDTYGNIISVKDGKVMKLCREQTKILTVMDI